MIRGVIFDFDGTLLDSLDAFWHAFNAGVKAFNLPPISRERLLAFMDHGEKLTDMIHETYPSLDTAHDPAIADSILAEIRKSMPEAYGSRIKLIPGTLEVLDSCKNRGMKIGMVTSRTSAPERLKEELKQFNILHYFDAVVTSANAPRKPAPDTVLTCLELLNLTPIESVIIGDSQADVRAGKAVGMFTIAISNGVSPLNTLQAEHPTYIFDNLMQMYNKLDIILGEQILTAGKENMTKSTYRDLFLFAAKVGAMEGYFYKRDKADQLTNWVNNIVDGYAALPAVIKKEITGELLVVLKRILAADNGKLLEPAERAKLQQLLFEVQAVA